MTYIPRDSGEWDFEVSSLYSSEEVAEKIFWPIIDARTTIDWRTESDPGEFLETERDAFDIDGKTVVKFSAIHTPRDDDFVNGIHGVSMPQASVLVEHIATGSLRDEIISELTETYPEERFDEYDRERFIAKSVISFFFTAAGDSKVGRSTQVEVIPDPDDDENTDEIEWLVAGDGMPEPIFAEEDEIEQEIDDDDDIIDIADIARGHVQAVFCAEDIKSLAFAAGVLRLPEVQAAALAMITAEPKAA